LGHGTGSFAKEYQRVASKELFVTKNPHNEFLMISVQLGFLGVLIYLGFLASQYYYAKNCPIKKNGLPKVFYSLNCHQFIQQSFYGQRRRHWFASMIALCFASLQANIKALTNNA